MKKLPAFILALSMAFLATSEAPKKIFHLPDTENSFAIKAEAADESLWEKTSDNYQYLQLENDEERALYNSILEVYKNAYFGQVTAYDKEFDDDLTCIGEIPIENIEPYKAMDIYMEVKIDHPLIYFASSNIVAEGSDVYIFADKAFDTPEELNEGTAKVESALKKLSAELDTASDGVGKASAAHDSIINAVDYAYKADGVTPDDSVYAHNIIGYAMGNNIVCDGYAKTYMAVLRMNGIDCKISTGVYSITNEAHAWNVVDLDGSYYAVDLTLDDVNGMVNTTYLLVGKNIYQTHRITHNNSSYEFIAAAPVLSDSDHKMDNVLDGDFLYTYNHGHLYLKEYSGTDSHVIVPPMAKGIPVYGILQYAFYCANEMTELTLEEGIVYMGAIYFCKNLKTLNLPSTFYCGDFNNSVRGLGGFADRCESLEKINLSAGNKTLTVVDNVLYSKDLRHLVLYPSGKTDEEYTLPSTLVSIQDDSFANNVYIKSVVLPDTIEYIGYWAFSGSLNLKSINIPKNCEAIGQFAFRSTGIENIYIPAKTTFIGTYAFDCPKLKTITVDPDNTEFKAVDGMLCTKDSVLAYENASDREWIVVPDGITTINYAAFYYALNLKRIAIPESISTLEKGCLPHQGDIELYIAGPVPNTISDAKSNGTLYLSREASYIVSPQ